MGSHWESIADQNQPHHVPAGVRALLHAPHLAEVAAHVWMLPSIAALQEDTCGLAPRCMHVHSMQAHLSP